MPQNLPQKDGASISPAPQFVASGKGRIVPLADRVRVEAHIVTDVYDDQSLVAVEFLQFFPPLEDQFGRQHFCHSFAPGRTQEGAGVDTPSGSSATDNHVIHSSSFSSEPEQHHA